MRAVLEELPEVAARQGCCVLSRAGCTAAHPQELVVVVAHCLDVKSRETRSVPAVFWTRHLRVRRHLLTNGNTVQGADDVDGGVVTPRLEAQRGLASPRGTPQRHPRL